MDLWGAIYVGGLVGCRRGGQKMPEYQHGVLTHGVHTYVLRCQNRRQDIILGFLRR